MIPVEKVAGVWVRWAGLPNLTPAKVQHLVTRGVWRQHDLDRQCPGVVMARPHQLAPGFVRVGVERFRPRGAEIVQEFDVREVPVRSSGLPDDTREQNDEATP